MGIDQPFKQTPSDCVQDAPAVLSAQVGNMWRQGHSSGTANDAVFSANRQTGPLNENLPTLDLMPPPKESPAPPAPAAPGFGPREAAIKANNGLLHNFAHSNDDQSILSRARQFFFGSEFYKNIDGSSPTAWDMGEVYDATLSMHDPSIKHELKQVHTDLDKFWDPGSQGGKGTGHPGYNSTHGLFSGDKFYDDNAWIGIASLDEYKRTHNQSNLDRAKQIFSLESYGAQGTEKMAKPGGVLWTQNPDDTYRATVSTAGAAQLALELYQQTGDSTYKAFAIKQFDWVNENLRAPNRADGSGGLYYDGMDKDGIIKEDGKDRDGSDRGGKDKDGKDKVNHTTEWTYNQGLMLGDATLLYQATGDHKYLNEAQDIAKRSLQQLHKQFDIAGSSSVSAKRTFFNAVFFKNLMLLDSVQPDPTYREALAKYSADLAQKLDPHTALVKFSDKGQLLGQASAVQIFALARDNPPPSSNQ